MTNSKIVLGIALVAVVIATGAYFFPKSTDKVSVDKVVALAQERLKTLGGVPTLDGVDNPYVTINGNSWYYYQQAMEATSSVPCSIKNPFGATSTAIRYSAVATANGLGSQNITLSTSTTAYASSTPYFVKNFVTSAGPFNMLWTPMASTTGSALIGMETSGAIGNSNIIIGPTEYLNLKIATSTGTAGTFSSYFTGVCRATILKL